MPAYIQVNSGGGPKVATGATYTEAANTVQDWKRMVGETYPLSYTLWADPVSTATSLGHLLEIMAGPSLKLRLRRIEVWTDTAATAAALMSAAPYRIITAGTGGTNINPA